MSTNIRLSAECAHFDPAQCLVEIERESRNLRALLSEMRTLDFRPIIQSAQRIEEMAFEIDRWASNTELDKDEDKDWTGFVKMCERINKYFGEKK
jgi:hypothetical protein